MIYPLTKKNVKKPEDDLMTSGALVHTCTISLRKYYITWEKHVSKIWSLMNNKFRKAKKEKLRKNIQQIDDFFRGKNQNLSVYICLIYV